MSPDQIKDLANSIISSAAPQPPVEGLRETVSRIIEPSIFDHDGAGSMIEFMGQARRQTALEKADAILTALASPSLTAGRSEIQSSDGGVVADTPSNETAKEVMAHPSPMGSRSCDEKTIACGVVGVAPGPSESVSESYNDALGHLGSVLSILAELHPDDRSRALDNALAYYNARRPGAQVEPVAGVTRLVHQWHSPSVSLEEIARIVDPVAWTQQDRVGKFVTYVKGIAPSLEKADAILALLSAQPAKGER